MELQINKYYSKLDVFSSVNKDLVHLILELKGNNLKNLEIGKLVEFLQRQSNLQTLILDIRSNDIDDKGLSEFAMGLRKCFDLRVFQLDFRNNRINTIKDLSMALGSLKNLYKLIINFSAKKIKDITFKLHNEELSLLIYELFKCQNLKEWQVYLKVSNGQYREGFYIKQDNFLGSQLSLRMQHLKLENCILSFLNKNLKTLILLKQDKDIDLSIIQNFSNLENLVLQILIYKNDESINIDTQLAILFDSLKNLKTLKLDLGQLNQTKKKNVFLSIQQCQKNLRDLYVETELSCDKIFCILNFSNLNNLKILSLEIKPSKNSYQKQFQNFLVQLGYCKNLVVLQIYQTCRYDLIFNKSFKKAKRLVSFKLKNGWYFFDIFEPSPIQDNIYDQFQSKPLKKML